MAIKAILAMALACWLALQCTQAAPRYERDVDSFENGVTVHLAKRLLEDEKAWLNRLMEIERREGETSARDRVCRCGYGKGMACKPC